MEPDINAQVHGLQLAISVHDDLKWIYKCLDRKYTNATHERERKRMVKKLEKLMKDKNYYESDPYGA